MSDGAGQLQLDRLLLELG
ncbi:MAG: hypothetical protein ACLRQF_21600 [Thomasclavelia ramosa]